MFRKTFISFAATLALGFGIVGITSEAESKDQRVFHSRADHYAYPDYFDGYYYEDCRYRRILVKKWNKAHTHLIKVYKKRWVCY